MNTNCVYMESEINDNLCLPDGLKSKSKHRATIQTGFKPTVLECWKVP